MTTIFKTTLGLLLLTICSQASSAAEPQFPRHAKRILFLGDSITNSGHYISMIEAELLLQSDGQIPELINLGLPSETCSGLSEPDHPFPRPDVHERIGRALAKIQPDVVVACYGMNDGIYYPFSEDRFVKYQQGIRDIIKKVHASGAKLILMTPPAFDPLPLKAQGKLLPIGAEKYAWFSIYEDYDNVLAKYAAWELTLRNEVEMVIDLHTPVNQYLTQQRQSNPDFTMSPDGVHVNVEGHAVLAKSILKAWKIEPSNIEDEQLEKLIHQRQMLLHNAWLSHVGHLRPGVQPGLPLKEAELHAADLKTQITDRLVRLRPLLDSSQGAVHHLYYPASEKADELSLAVDYYLWIPPEAKHLRGVIVHQHGCGDGASKGGATAAHDLHWQTLARKWNCALLGSSYEGRAGIDCRAWCDPRRGSAAKFEQALEDFAKLTGHAEVAHTPWCLWGHSGGGFWASIMQAMYPERILAVFLQSGQAYSRWTTGEIPPLEVPKLAYGVPVLACPGFKEKSDQRFHVAWDGCWAMFQAYRKENAPFIFAPDPRTGHECGDSRYLAIPFFDVCLERRLPEWDPDQGATEQWPADNPFGLVPVEMSQGLLATPDGKTVQAVSAFNEDRATAVWLPDEQFAAKWSEFLRVGSVSDQSPPSAPVAVRFEAVPNGKGRITWNAVADFESGLAGFRIMKGGKLLTEIPTKPSGRFGRPLFQKMSYHDTPEQPLLKMSYEFESSQFNGAAFEILSVNSVGLESVPVVVHLEK